MKDTVGRWNLQEFGLYNPMSGVTTNQSEGFNSVWKRLQGWKEIPIDTGLLTLYYLHVYYWNEWQRGLAGILANVIMFASNIIILLCIFYRTRRVCVIK